jgi:hypothetical protein
MLGGIARADYQVYLIPSLLVRLPMVS